jgi:hypothetical protein
MTSAAVSCTNSGSELLMFGPDLNHTIYIRLPIRVPRNSVINVARLILEASFSGTTEFWDGNMDVSAKEIRFFCFHLEGKKGYDSN